LEDAPKSLLTRRQPKPPVPALKIEFEFEFEDGDEDENEDNDERDFQTKLRILEIFSATGVID
jgi:hypothetical protein